MAEAAEFHLLEHRIGQPAKRARAADPDRRCDQRIDRLIPAAVIPAKGSATLETPARPAQLLAVRHYPPAPAPPPQRNPHCQRHPIANFGHTPPPIPLAHASSRATAGQNEE